MPRSSGTAVQNSFVKGLQTEATGLSFPENACTETLNCIFDNLGTVSRRLGLDFESNYDPYSTDLTGCVINRFLWRNAGGDGDISFVVVQIGNTLHFYKVTGSGALSAQKHATTIDLTAHLPTSVTSVSTLECSFTAGNGVLFVANQRMDTFYVEYDSDANTFTVTEYDIKIRDFEGDTTDTLAVDERPIATAASITAAHKYNLFNQSWNVSSLGKWDAVRTDIPSNTDVSWTFKDSTGKFAFGDANVKAKVDDASTGNSPASGGHYIYSLYNINRSSNVSGATDETEDLNRISTIAFYAGRVFHAGLRTPKRGSQIFFSSTVQSKADYGNCYQVNDPTSETLFDELATDGGIIDILDAGTILKMMPVLNVLVVFATNGIWAISGSQGLGFTATDYSINKISSIPNASVTSFVDVEGMPFWWNLDSIYTIVHNNNAFDVKSLTRTTIHSFYSEIPLESKTLARGAYDPIEKRIVWVYKSRAANNFEDRYSFDSVLNFNLVTEAFFPWTISDTNVRISGVVNIANLGGSLTQETVTNSAVTVTYLGDPVVVFTSDTGQGSFTTKFLVSYPDTGSLRAVTFAEELNDAYVDWESFDDDGEAFESFFTSGYILRSKGLGRFNNDYLMVYANNDVSSSFRIRGQWNYSISGNSGQWGTAQTFYTTDTSNFSMKPVKIRIRGLGVVLQYKIYNNLNLPFSIFGWSTMDSANQLP